MKLYDAARCPYCARVRMALVEKGLEAEVVAIDLEDRPTWLYELNPSGRVPVLDDGFVLPESDVILAYLEERYPDPPLLPPDPEGRARARLAVRRFDEALGADYYAFRRGAANELRRRLEELRLGESLYVDIAYAPWVIRARDLQRMPLPAHLEAWLQEASTRLSFAQEFELVAAL